MNVQTDFRPQISEAEPRDFGQINEVAVEAWQSLRLGYDPQRWDALMQGISRMSDLATLGTLLVAKHAERVLGAICYVPPGRSPASMFPSDWAVLRMLVVRPDSRGRGIGRKLTEECIELARRAGAPCIGLHTSKIMTVALPMYLRMGFSDDGELPDMAGAPYRRYTLTLSYQ